MEDRPITVGYELIVKDHNDKLIFSQKTEHTFIPEHNSWGKPDPKNLKEAHTVTIDFRVMKWQVQN